MYEIKAMVEPWTVKEVRELSGASYVIRFNRNNMDFKPGQHLVAGLLNSRDAREYSIYSGANDKYLEILIREIEDGVVSKKLHSVKKGELLEIHGPYGFFMYNANPPADKKLIFIASGTGIAPFHSFAKTYPDADYRIIHGIRTAGESYGREDFRKDRYLACTSRDNSGEYQGRVTDYLKEAELDKDNLFYFCGNSNMILDSMDILQKRGIPQAQMFTEVYF